ncbi:21 kDa subunit of NADH dehydrogenase [Durotheca rogersii]|uniref:21 kDa subunit of NADH dehydrogenase n=1 Tax=Durotheca rogersii TaxID=419775 RepID=UPI00221F79A4|nr:21 kDa subunit of NADH dehydrogenase [Durotheca rogersii]KAI5860167.1 21 kDa subunit of NADH dehydrogenase [Durotheca rogersii]
MASKAVAKAAGGVVSITQKQTLQSTGIWERIRRFFAVSPERSNGVPLNPYFRNPPPGALDPLTYDDPVTAPAGDIADNAYWRRDVRRAYPQLSVVRQADAAALLAVGSSAAPRRELIGEAGENALVAAREEGRTAGLAAQIAKGASAGAGDGSELFRDGLPPLPSGQSLRAADGKWEVYKYDLAEDSYGEAYPCRNFK